MKIDYKMIKPFVKQNLPSILNSVAILGIGATGWFSHRAARKSDPNEPFSKHWKNYILPVAAGIGSAACIAAANRIHLSREAALTAAVVFYKTMHEDFEDAVFDKFSDAGLKENVVDHSNPNLQSDNIKIKIWEPYTKQYFEATQKEILWAELTANKLLQQAGRVTLNDVLSFYNDKNIKKKKIGGHLGWSWDNDEFCESSGYYYAGGWIDMCPQFDDSLGNCRFVMDYGINPVDLTDG